MPVSQLSQLNLWIDPMPRSGGENMAIDEWLLETIDEPVLRVYGWLPRWGSLGCFCELSETAKFDSSLRWVRRLTGGGLVDHRTDWTYSLILPRAEPVAQMKGALSYQWIHQTLAIALNDRSKQFFEATAKSGLGGSCFARPVNHDLVTADGSKLAGAGQRRTNRGLLHQGSVGGYCEPIDSIDRSKRFAIALCKEFSIGEVEVPCDLISEKIAARYDNSDWLHRR